MKKDKKMTISEKDASDISIALRILIEIVGDEDMTIFAAVLNEQADLKDRTLTEFPATAKLLTELRDLTDKALDAIGRVRKENSQNEKAEN